MTPQTLTTETCTQKLFHNCPDSKTRTTEQRSPRGFQSPDPGAGSPPGRYSSGPLAPDGADPPGRVSTPPPLPPEGRLKHRGATAPHSHTAAAASAQKLLPRRRARPGARALPATKGGASLLAAAPLAPLLGVPAAGRLRAGRRRWRNCRRGFLGRGQTNSPSFCFAFSKSGWNLRSPDEAAFPLPQACSRTSLPLFHPKSLRRHQTEHPALPSGSPGGTGPRRGGARGPLFRPPRLRPTPPPTALARLPGQSGARGPPWGTRPRRHSPDSSSGSSPVSVSSPQMTK